MRMPASFKRAKLFLFERWIKEKIKMKNEAQIITKIISSTRRMARKLSFSENFALSGCVAVISKTAVAPIESIKLLIQNQDEMIKQVSYLLL